MPHPPVKFLPQNPARPPSEPSQVAASVPSSPKEEPDEFEEEDEAGRYLFRGFEVLGSGVEGLRLKVQGLG